MSRHGLWRGLCLVGILTGGCSDPDAVDTGMPMTGDTGDATTGTPLLTLTDADVMQVTTDFTVAVQAVAPEQDIELRWDGLSTNDLGVPLVDSDTITNVELSQFTAHDPTELQNALSDGSLEQRDVAVSVRCTPTDGACRLTDFVFEAGHAVDVVEALTVDSGSWLVSLREEGQEVPAARLVLIVNPSGNATEVQLDDDSSSIRVHSVGTGSWVELPAEPRIQVDWSQLTRTGQGSELLPTTLESVVLARVPSNIEIEALTLRLPEIAVQTWSGNAYGLDGVVLSELVDPAGGDDAHFSSFDTEDSFDRWFLALYGSSTDLVPQAALVPLAPD